MNVGGDSEPEEDEDEESRFLCLIDFSGDEMDPFRTLPVRSGDTDPDSDPEEEEASSAGDADDSLRGLGGEAEVE